MLIEKISQLALEARQNKDQKSAPLLVTLLSEVKKIGKDKLREPTDEDAMAVIRKFIAGLDQTIELTQGRADRKEHFDQAHFERELLVQFLPVQLTDAKLRDVINEAIAGLPRPITPKSMGAVMNALKASYPGQYDSAKASAYAKEALGAAK